MAKKAAVKKTSKKTDAAKTPKSPSRKEVTEKAVAAVKGLKTIGEFNVTKATVDKKGRIILDIGGGMGLKLRVRGVKTG